MSLNDADVAALVRDAVNLVDPGRSVHVAPAADDDPYRWGRHGWTVTIGNGPRVRIWIPADAAPEWIRTEVTRRIAPEAAE